MEVCQNPTPNPLPFVKGEGSWRAVRGEGTGAMSGVRALTRRQGSGRWRDVRGEGAAAPSGVRALARRQG